MSILDHKLLHGPKLHYFFNVKVVLINRHYGVIDPLFSFLEFVVSNPNKFWVVGKTGRGRNLMVIEKIRYLNRIETLFIKGLNQQKTFELVFGYFL